MANNTFEDDKLSSDPWNVSAAEYKESDESNAAPKERPQNPEEIQRIQVEEEDKLAFRVGVNLITLGLLGTGIYFLIRYFMVAS